MLMDVHIVKVHRRPQTSYNRSCKPSPPEHSYGFLRQTEKGKVKSGFQMW